MYTHAVAVPILLIGQQCQAAAARDFDNRGFHEGLWQSHESRSRVDSAAEGRGVAQESKQGFDGVTGGRPLEA